MTEATGNPTKFEAVTTETTEEGYGAHHGHENTTEIAEVTTEAAKEGREAHRSHGKFIWFGIAVIEATDATGNATKFGEVATVRALPKAARIGEYI